MQPPLMFATQRNTTDVFHVCGCNGPIVVLLLLHVVMMNNICWEQKENNMECSYNREYPVSSLSDSGSSPSASRRQWQPQLAGRITYTLHVSWFGIFLQVLNLPVLQWDSWCCFCLYIYFREFYHRSLVKGLFWQLWAEESEKFIPFRRNQPPETICSSKWSW